jgi:hypothetical protein
MTATGSYDTAPSNGGRGATTGPPGCPVQSPPVPFRWRRRGGLQGLSASWGDWRGQKVFLIRKRSQVRVLAINTVRSRTSPQRSASASCGARPSGPARRSGWRRDGACTEYPAAARCRHAASALRPRADSETRVDGGFNAAARIASTVAGASGRTSSRCGWRAFRTDRTGLVAMCSAFTRRLENRAEQHQRLDNTARAGTPAQPIRLPARDRLRGQIPPAGQAGTGAS